MQMAADQPALVIPLTSRRSEVTWPPTGPFAETFYPYAFKFQDLKESNEGDLPRVDIAFDNSTRVLMDMAYQCAGFEGASVRLILLHEETIDDVDEFVRWDFEVQSSKADGKLMTLQLSTQNFFQVKVPSDRFVANRCRHAFGGRRCGYVVNEVAAFVACDKTRTACGARGDDESARGLPRLHPRRFGGFLGIPVQRQQ